MSLRQRHFGVTSLLGLIVGLPLVTVLTVAFVVDEVFAQEQPGLLPCSGKKFQQNVPCTTSAACPGSTPCTSWVAADVVDNCEAPGAVPGMNCRYNTSRTIVCGTGGDCWFNDDLGECVYLAGNSTIWTNPVGQKNGDCIIPRPNPDDP